MTLEEINEIFSKAEIVIHNRAQYYQFYTFTNQRNRSGSVVDPKNLQSLVPLLDGYSFKEYAPGQIPVFVQNPIIEGK